VKEGLGIEYRGEKNEEAWGWWVEAVILIDVPLAELRIHVVKL